MDDKAKYLTEVESNLKKYKGDITKLNNIVKKYNAPNKKKVLAKDKVIKEKFKEAEAIYKKLKSSSQGNFGTIQEASSKIFSSLSENVDDFTHLVSMKDLTHLTENITDYSSERLSEMDDYIRKNPFHFVLGAFGVGILIGFFINRLK